MVNLKYLTCFLLNFISISAVSQLFGQTENEFSLSSQHLRGKVKQITSETYNTIEKFGEIQTGNLISKSVENFDMNGNCVDYCFIQNGEKLNVWIYNYNSENQLIKKTRKNNEGNIIELSIVKYNENGNISEESKYTNKGILIEKRLFLYEDNFCVKILVFDDEGALKSSNNFEYDISGNKIKDTETYNDETCENIFEYNSNGYVVFSYSSNFSIQIKYDENHNPIENIFTGWSSEISKRTYSYKYDKIGNVIEEIMFRSKSLEDIGKSEVIIFRKIEYYD